MARTLIVLAAVVACSVAAVAAFAGGSEAASSAVLIQRTFVSTAGSDSNPCTRAQPCRGFQAALQNTLPGGEVVALDSGGYGTFTVDKAVSVMGAPGVHAAISVFSGTGITVNAGTSDSVVLRNLVLTGLGGATGISFQSGFALRVESVTADGFGSYGLHATATDRALFLRNSSFTNNLFGVYLEAALRTYVAASRADGNVVGFLVEGGVGSIVRSAASDNGSSGFEFSSGVFTLADCVVAGNTEGVEVAGDATRVTLSGTLLMNNSSAGLRVRVGTPVARVGGSTVTGNFIGLRHDGGTLETFGDNLVRGNTTNTFGTITTVAKT